MAPRRAWWVYGLIQGDAGTKAVMKSRDDAGLNTLLAVGSNPKTPMMSELKVLYCGKLLSGFCAAGLQPRHVQERDRTRGRRLIRRTVRRVHLEEEPDDRVALIEDHSCFRHLQDPGVGRNARLLHGARLGDAVHPIDDRTTSAKTRCRQQEHTGCANDTV